MTLTRSIVLTLLLVEGSQSVDMSGKLHVCSVCGIVYVPKEGAK